MPERIRCSCGTSLRGSSCRLRRSSGVAPSPGTRRRSLRNTGRRCRSSWSARPRESDLLTASDCGLLARDAPERRSNRHADACDVAFAKHITSHDFAGGEDILGCRAVAHEDARGLVDFQAEIGEGYSRLECVAKKRRAIDRQRPMALLWREARGGSVVEDSVVERAAAN